MAGQNDWLLPIPIPVWPLGFSNGSTSPSAADDYLVPQAIPLLPLPADYVDTEVAAAIDHQIIYLGWLMHTYQHVATLANTCQLLPRGTPLPTKVSINLPITSSMSVEVSHAVKKSRECERKVLGCNHWWAGWCWCNRTIMKATYSAGHFSAAALFRETQLPTLSSTPGPSELKFSQVEPEGLEPLDGVHMALPI